MNVKFSLSLALMCMATAAYAAKGSPQAQWPLEPTSFIGIKFDQNLIYQLKECPSNYSVPDEICYKKPFRGYYPLFAVPSLGLHGYTAGVATHDSLIQEIILATKIEDYEALKLMLVQKYGKPTLQGAEPVKTRAGATFQNEKLYWEGLKVSIILTKYSDTIDKSALSVINNAVAIKAVKAEHDKLIKNASQL